MTFEQWFGEQISAMRLRPIDRAGAKAAWDAALKVGAEAQRERDAKIADSQWEVAHSSCLTEECTEIAQAIRSAPIEGECHAK